MVWKSDVPDVSCVKSTRHDDSTPAADVTDSAAQPRKSRAGSFLEGIQLLMQDNVKLIHKGRHCLIVLEVELATRIETQLSVATICKGECSVIATEQISWL